MVAMHVTLWHYTNVCTLLHGNGTTYTNYGMYGIINVCHTMYIWHGTNACHTIALCQYVTLRHEANACHCYKIEHM